MPDKPKIEFESGCYYHIYNHGNSSDNLFVEQANYYFFLKRLNFYISDVTDLYSWCLLPNHFHILVRIKDNCINSEGINVIPDHKMVSERFRHFFTSYSKAINKKYNRRGTLFLRSFHRKKINDENYLRNIIRYIHMNPVSHGFTMTADTWLHSSFNNVQNYPEGTLSKEIIGYFGDMKDFIESHQGASPIDEKEFI
ncbi:MAG: transposase [Bacteroidia bacterium]